jgi:hypothetical protein
MALLGSEAPQEAPEQPMLCFWASLGDGPKQLGVQLSAAPTKALESIQRHSLITDRSNILTHCPRFSSSHRVIKFA